MFKRLLYSPKVTPYVLIAPAMLYFGVVWIYPLVMNLYISLFNWHFAKPSTFVGLDNYTDLLGDGDFFKDLQNALVYTLFLPLNLIPAFFVALAVNNIKRGKAFFRVAFYATSIISLYALALTFRFLFAEEVGLINNTLAGWGFQKIPWFSSPIWTIVVISLLVAYRGVGYNMLIYLAGLQSLDNTLYESARIDGAGRLALMWHLTIPLMRPVITYTVIMGVIYLLQLFSPIIIIASRGSFTQIADVRTPTVEAYLYTFALDQAGYGTAMMVAMSVIVLALSALIFRITDRGEI